MFNLSTATLLSILVYWVTVTALIATSNDALSTEQYEWQNGSRSVVTQKVPRRPKPERYEYKINKDGTVFIKTKLRHKFRNPGQSQPAVYPTNQVPGEMRWLCSHIYGTELQSMVTIPNTKSGLIRGPEYLTNIVEAKCLSPTQFAEKAQRLENEAASRATETAIRYKAESERALVKAAKAAALVASERAQILRRQKADCTSYGFAPTTDGHAKCVLDLAVAEREMQQKMTRLQEQATAKARAETRRNYELTKLMSEANAASEAAAEDAKKQRQAQALMGLGSAISSGGMPSRSSTPPPTAPLSSGRYKTCTYRVAGEIVPVTVGRAELCSATKLIGGQTGYLVR